jgi:hypothetical protein
MKKGLLTLLAGVMAFGVAVQSMASARIDSMSSDPRLVEDYDLIWLYPNKVLQYKNTFDIRLNAGPFSGGGPSATTSNATNGDFGGGVNEWGGLLIEEESLGGVLGIYINRPARLYTSAHSAFSGPGMAARYYWYYPGANDFAPRKLVDVFYGVALEGADLGVHVNYGDNGVGPSQIERMVLGLALGLGFTDFGPFNEANLHASYDLFSATFEGFNGPGQNETDNGISTIKVGGLFSSDADDNTSIRLSGDVQLDNWNVEDSFGFSQSAFQVLLGLGCNHKVNGGKGMVNSGFLLNWMSGNFENTSVENASNAWALIWASSVETEVASWLTLRTGIQKAIVGRYYEENNGYYDTNGWPNSVFNVGFGINWQNFVLDSQVNVSSLESLIAGPNAGAGIFYPGNNAQGIVSVAQADLKYRF